MTPLSLLAMGRKRASGGVEYINAFSQQNTSGSTSLAIATSSIVASDFLLACMGSDSSLTWTGDTGWTELVDQGVSPALRAAWLSPGSSGSPTYTFTSSSSKPLGGAILQFRGAQIDITGTIGTSGTGTTVVAPGITPTSGSTVIGVFFKDTTSSMSWSSISGWTLRAQNDDIYTPQWAIFTRDAVADGSAISDVTVTHTSRTGNNAGLLLSIKPL